MSVPHAHLDFETRAVVDLKKTGLYVYAEHPDTDVWCACYAIGDGPIHTWRPGDPPPADLMDILAGGGLIYSHNFSFEGAIIASIMGPRYGWTVPKIENARCTAAMAAAMSLPRDLASAAVAMGLPEQKDMAGKRLMLQLAKPRRMENGRPIWWDVPEKVQRLIDYCVQDVEVERALAKRLRPLSEAEQRIWELDHRINSRGVQVDLAGVKAAAEIVRKGVDSLNKELSVVTQHRVQSLTQVSNLADWLREQGVDVDSLDKAAIVEHLKTDLPANARRAIEIRQEGAKSSTAKLEAFLLRTNRDGRTRETLMYHGASTGRWSGRGVQLQNLPRPRKSMTFPNVVAALDAMAFRDPDYLELWGPPLQVVSDCLRSFIVAGEGKEFVMADFSNIEGRVLAWLAGEEWKVKAFREFDAGRGPDIYLVAAAGIYGVPIHTLDEDSPERQVGKVAELACGYQGGVGAFQSMAALYGLSIPDAQADEIKSAWRAKHPATVQFWYDLERAAYNAVAAPGLTYTVGHVAFASRRGILWCRLPSGRFLAYIDPKIREVETPWGEMKEAVTYMGVDSYTRQWTRCKAYGGLWAENVTQAVARDIMADAMLRIEARGWPVVLTVHDEVVSEVDTGTVTAADYEAEMVRLPAWATGLPIAAKGLTSPRYRK